MLHHYTFSFFCLCRAELFPWKNLRERSKRSRRAKASGKGKVCNKINCLSSKSASHYTNHFVLYSFIPCSWWDGCVGDVNTNLREVNLDNNSSRIVGSSEIVSFWAGILSTAIMNGDSDKSNLREIVA